MQNNPTQVHDVMSTAKMGVNWKKRDSFLLIPVILSLIFLGATVQPAYVAGTIVVNAATCPARPLSGTWNATTNTCTVNGFFQGDPATTAQVNAGLALVNMNGNTITNGGKIIVQNGGAGALESDGIGSEEWHSVL